MKRWLCFVLVFVVGISSLSFGESPCDEKIKTVKNVMGEPDSAMCEENKAVLWYSNNTYLFRWGKDIDGCIMDKIATKVAIPDSVEVKKEEKESVLEGCIGGFLEIGITIIVVCALIMLFSGE